MEEKKSGDKASEAIDQALFREMAIAQIERDMNAIFNFDNYPALCAIRERATPDSPLYFLVANAPQRSSSYFKEKPAEQEILKLTDELLKILKKCEDFRDSAERVMKEEMRQLDYPTFQRLYREITSYRFIKKVLDREKNLRGTP